MKVLKFGGASIATADKFKLVADLVSKQKGIIVVLSAIEGVTPLLTDVSNYLYQRNQEGANELINKLEKKYCSFIEDLYLSAASKKEAGLLLGSTIDHIRSFINDAFTLFEEREVLAQGELLSSKLFHILLEEKQIEAIHVSALDIMRIDKNSEPDALYIKKQLSNILTTDSESLIYITQGFICKNSYGEVDNLRRGGSDYTASLIGSAIGAQEIQIWSDVDGLQNTETSVVNQSKVNKLLSFDEAAELAYFGAKMLHPTSMFPAKLANIKVRLLNIFKPDSEGLLISNETESGSIKAIAAKDGITAIKIKSGRMLLAHGFLRRIFEVFEHYRTPIDMLTTSEVGVSVTIDDNRNLENIVNDLKKYGTVSIDEQMTMICIVGDLDWEDMKVGSMVLDVIKDVPTRMISYGGSNYNISFLVREEDKEKALKSLNDKLF